MPLCNLKWLLYNIVSYWCTTTKLLYKYIKILLWLPNFTKYEAFTIMELNVWWSGLTNFILYILMFLYILYWPNCPCFAHSMLKALPHIVICLHIVHRFYFVYIFFSCNYTCNRKHVKTSNNKLVYMNNREIYTYFGVRKNKH